MTPPPLKFEQLFLENAFRELKLMALPRAIMIWLGKTAADELVRSAEGKTQTDKFRVRKKEMFKMVEKLG